MKSAAQRRNLGLVLLLAALAISLAAVILPLTANPLTPAPQAGQVAEREFRSPHSVTYTSQVATDQQRELAVNSVLPVYTSPDTRVARRQMEQLRAALAYINSVRSDAYASQEQKLSDLKALEDVHLDDNTLNAMLLMSDAHWQEIQQETLAVLERVMRSSLRADGMAETISRVPALVSLSLSEDQVSIVAALASAFVEPNSQVDKAATQAARQAARQGVEPVSRSLAAGQIIALQGQIYTPEDIEAIHVLGLEQTPRSWTDLTGAVLLVLLMIFLGAFYMRRKQALFSGEMRKTGVVTGLFLAFLVSARLFMPLYPQVVYAFPLAAYGMTTAVLFGIELAIMTSLPMAVLATYGLPDGMELVLYFLVASVAGILALGRARRLGAFLLAGVLSALAGTATILAYRLPLPDLVPTSLLTPLILAVLSGLIAASLTILLHSLLAQLLGTATPMQLVDLTRPNHPLLRILLRDAPGTYQHSLQVANLVEQAAERIGLDPLLVHVGSLYHDIGKTCNAVFFIENQPPGFINPHEDLDPAESATVILRHVADGLELGRKYRLPRRILEFVTEHHGTTLTRYQYVKAVKMAGGDESRVDASRFRYLGPQPQSRETGLLMLADGVEARVRAELPEDEDTLRTIVRSVVSDRVSSGQLDDTRLTLRDLNIIIDSFTMTLRSMYHPRVRYPRLETTPAPAMLPDERKTVPVAHPSDPRP